MCEDSCNIPLHPCDLYSVAFSPERSNTAALSRSLLFEFWLQMKLTLIELDDPAAEKSWIRDYLTEDVPEGIDPVNNTGALCALLGSRWQCVENSTVSTINL